MAQSPPAKEKSRDKDLTITRIFNAPRDLVWMVWTEPEFVMRWWGPEGFTSPVARIDFRVGGKYLYCMRSPECEDFWSTGEYREIVPLERIVATDSFSDEMGNILPAAHYGMTGIWPKELLVTVTLEEHDGGKTKFTLVHTGIPPGDSVESARAGWNGSFDKLDRLLDEAVSRTGKTLLVAIPGRQDAYMTRVFDAPRERVFRAITDPDLITQWWAPARYTIEVEKMEVKPGGMWRYLNRDAEGNESWFHGVYHDVTPGRIVETFEYEGMPGHVLLGIETLEELDGGRTKLTSRSVFESVADRDGMLESGMREGGVETLDRLAKLVEMK
ncbi:uncharacterized protein YndB with AHSA1/START domain [Methanolinea mesophila]|uniref:SRPBCC domain-containing protein n=1 Tax=Methanolinea mesophila TaxID=547055 RepID=UPI001AEB77B3|nr:SRPBCC domain-containing protein [Methanolinea mesophila]MBP1929943.1 uncharacterized protein YndB with AHSA1/START domain [Methanolinea mesophila]